jgi:TatA/E family protein of Tat protein translocase
MFDLGMQELIVIFIVALLVFGPKRLPELSRALGKGVRELKIALRGVKDSFDEAESQVEETFSPDVYKESQEEDKGKASPDLKDPQSSSPDGEGDTNDKKETLSPDIYKEPQEEDTGKASPDLKDPRSSPPDGEADTGDKKETTDNG